MVRYKTVLVSVVPRTASAAGRAQRVIVRCGKARRASGKSRRRGHLEGAHQALKATNSLRVREACRRSDVRLVQALNPTGARGDAVIQTAITNSDEQI